MIPRFKPHFLNLRATPQATLEQEGGFFGQILRLIQQQKGEMASFRLTLTEVMTNLEKMSSSDWTRWTEFLSYVLALVYHARSGQEQKECCEVVDHSMQTDPHRKEYSNMDRTMAEILMDRGRVQGEITGEQKGAIRHGRGILLRHLKKRFKTVPRKVQDRIGKTADLALLDKWLDNVLDAETLADVGIM